MAYESAFRLQKLYLDKEGEKTAWAGREKCYDHGKCLALGLPQDRSNTVSQVKIRVSFTTVRSFSPKKAASNGIVVNYEVFT